MKSYGIDLETGDEIFATPSKEEVIDFYDRLIEKTFRLPISSCTNPAGKCPACPRWKKDCDGLEKYEMEIDQ